MTLLNRIVPALALLSVIAVGCDTVVQEPAQPPTLIPAQAFTVQTELFDQAPMGESEIGTDAMIARMRVWPVTTALEDHLSVPAAVTRAALEEDPVIQGGAWTWAATTSVEGRSVHFTLSGSLRGEHVEWVMQLTPDTAETEPDSVFVLYTATTELDGSAGSWELFSPDGDTTANVLNAEFEMGKEGKKEITFHVAEGASEHVGDSIVYTREGEERSFRWMQAAAAREHLVVWNAKSYAGSITATNYNSGQKACWGESLENVACSQQ